MSKPIHYIQAQIEIASENLRIVKSDDKYIECRKTLSNYYENRLSTLRKEESRSIGNIKVHGELLVKSSISG